LDARGKVRVAFCIGIGLPRVPASMCPPCLPRVYAAVALLVRLASPTQLAGAAAALPPRRLLLPRASSVASSRKPHDHDPHVPVRRAGRYRPQLERVCGCLCGVRGVLLEAAIRESLCLALRYWRRQAGVGFCFSCTLAVDLDELWLCTSAARPLRTHTLHSITHATALILIQRYNIFAFSLSPFPGLRWLFVCPA